MSNEQAKSPIEQLKEKFLALPKQQQMLVIGMGGLFLFVFLTRGGSDDQEIIVPQQQTQVQNERLGGGQLSGTQTSFQQVDDGSFVAPKMNDEALRQGYFQRQEEILKERLDQVEELRNQLESKGKENENLVRKLESMSTRVETVLDEKLKQIEQQNKRYQSDMERLAEQAQKQQFGANRQGGGAQLNNQQGLPGGNVPREAVRRQLKPIQQHVQGRAGGPGSPHINSDQALLQATVGAATNGRLGANDVADDDAQAVEEPNPFLPPIGFVKGRLLNGVDALTSGSTTPSLVRIEGAYKTAMNSTVNLDGCFILVEFQGDIATERASGALSRMTCVYPDQGAITYDMSGYVVDYEDGIVGLPGLFYEGDGNRLAAAITADFAYGMTQVIVENQQDTTTSDEGTTKKTLSGDEAKASLAGGAGESISTLRDYLKERAERVTPFIRIEARRPIHMVILNGQVLRKEAKTWTTLVEGN